MRQIKKQNLKFPLFIFLLLNTALPAPLDPSPASTSNVNELTIAE
jgi:hypothetical protein